MPLIIPGAFCHYSMLPLFHDYTEYDYMVFMMTSARTSIISGLRAKATKKKRRVLAFISEVNPVL